MSSSTEWRRPLFRFYRAYVTTQVYHSRRFCSFIAAKAPWGVRPPLKPEGNRKGIARKVIDMDYFTPDKIRNFCIIAHIDHGKTTLSDAMLRRTGVLPDTGTSLPKCGYLDKLDVERDRGITVKAQPCSMFIKPPDKNDIFMCNLIDTPGHADFSYECVKSLSVCESAILLVDVSQGIQAQTMSNFHLAMEKNVHIIPTLSKLDRVGQKSEIDAAEEEMEQSLGVFKSEILHTSAKKLLGVEALLQDIINNSPCPHIKTQFDLQATIFDAWPEKDFIRCFVRVIKGTLREGHWTRLHHSSTCITIKEVGIMFPDPVRTISLHAGHVGYILLPREALQTVDLIGETVLEAQAPGQSISRAFRPNKPVVFAGFYPDGESNSSALERALVKLTTNDSSVTLQKVTCTALGSGFQLGFLGVLHMKVFRDRLIFEFNEAVLVTPATIDYRAQLSNGQEISVTRASLDRYQAKIAYFLQPITNATVVCDEKYQTNVRDLFEKRYEATPMDHRILRWNRVSFIYRLPLVAFSRGLFDQLKIVTKGYSTIEYDDPVYEPCDIIMLSLFIEDIEIEALCMPVERKEAYQLGRAFCLALKRNISRSTLDIPITARLGGKIIARETVAGVRKNVTHKCHAGDPTRKMKLLNNQKKARKYNASRRVGSVEIGSEAILEVMKTMR